MRPDCIAFPKRDYCTVGPIKCQYIHIFLPHLSVRGGLSAVNDTDYKALQYLTYFNSISSFTDVNGKLK